MGKRVSTVNKLAKVRLAKMWELYHFEGKPITRKMLCDAFGISLRGVQTYVKRLSRQGYDLPPIMNEREYNNTYAPKHIKSNNLRAGKDYTHHFPPSGLIVMDETIRPWGDNQWIGMIK